MDALRDWHDFYILIGTASATLVGLMFVAASVGVTFIDETREAPFRSFLTPTVLHFTVILVICLLGNVPSESPGSLGALVSATGLVGLAFACRVAINMRRRGITRTIDLTDRACYLVIPLFTYVAITAVGIVLSLNPNLGLDLLAALLIVLLVLGIRNAWDMTLWIVVRTPNR